MKNVTVYRTVGNNMKQFQTEARTWSELQKNLKEAGIDYSGMKAIVSESRNTLEAPDALIPETDFTLFLMPVKVKSGSERSDLFDLIKGLVAADPSKKPLFIIDGKNMTQLSTPVLAELWAKHGTGFGTAPATTPEKVEKAPKAVKANVADVVAAVGDFKELEEAVEAAKVKYQKAVAADVDEATQDILLDKLTAAKAALKTAQSAPAPKPVPVVKAAPVESPAEKAAREQKEWEESEKKRLLADARDVAKGLSGLQSF